MPRGEEGTCSQTWCGTNLVWLRAFMLVCMHECIHCVLVCIHVCMHCVHACMHVCMHAFVQFCYTCTCMHMHTHEQKNTCTHATCTHAHTISLTHKHINKHTHTHTHVCVLYVYVHIYTSVPKYTMYDTYIFTSNTCKYTYMYLIKTYTHIHT